MDMIAPKIAFHMLSAQNQGTFIYLIIIRRCLTSNGLVSYHRLLINTKEMDCKTEETYDFQLLIYHPSPKNIFP